MSCRCSPAPPSRLHSLSLSSSSAFYDIRDSPTPTTPRAVARGSGVCWFVPRRHGVVGVRGLLASSSIPAVSLVCSTLAIIPMLTHPVSTPRAVARSGGRGVVVIIVVSFITSSVRPSWHPPCCHSSTRDPPGEQASRHGHRYWVDLVASWRYWVAGAEVSSLGG